MRFIEGAPSLKTIVNGAPTDIGNASLRVNGTTVATAFPYGTITAFQPTPGTTLSLEAFDSVGYSVGPIKTDAPLVSGKRYSVILVGSYPNYRALTFEEPAPNDGATLAVYGASPALRTADFGRFAASHQSGFQKLGAVRFGELATAGVGKSVEDLGAYVGNGTKPIIRGALTIANVNPFDHRNALPFHNATRFSLFVFDPKSGSSLGPVFGSLDQ